MMTVIFLMKPVIVNINMLELDRKLSDLCFYQMLCNP